jgi:hypothetical protein
MMIRVVMSVVLVVAVAVVMAGCGSPSATTAAPTQAPPTQTSGAPASTPTAAPTEAPTVAPTEPLPTVAPTATTPREMVVFNWVPGSVPPSDSDDVDIIAAELTTHDGILSVTGNETVLNVVYDPTVITVEEIMAILKQIGHPVVINE